LPPGIGLRLVAAMMPANRGVNSISMVSRTPGCAAELAELMV